MRGRLPGTTIGFVGLGSMGGPLAGRLLYRNRVFGTNRTRSKASALIDRGLIWRDTPREVAAAADVLFSMVADDAALAAVTSGPDGILAGLQPGALYVEMSTVSPGASRELSRRVRAAGAAPRPDAVMAYSPKRGATSAMTAASNNKLMASTTPSAGTSPSTARAGHHTALFRPGASASSVCDCSMSVRDMVP